MHCGLEKVIFRAAPKKQCGSEDVQVIPDGHTHTHGETEKRLRRPNNGRVCVDVWACVCVWREGRERERC